MKLDTTERGQHYKMREVSDLRTQYQCEHRLHLKQSFGEPSSKASAMGSVLHDKISDQKRFQDNDREGRTLPLLIIIMTLVAGLLWILW